MLTLSLEQIIWLSGQLWLRKGNTQNIGRIMSIKRPVFHHRQQSNVESTVGKLCLQFQHMAPAPAFWFGRRLAVSEL